MYHFVCPFRHPSTKIIRILRNNVPDRDFNNKTNGTQCTQRTTNNAFAKGVLFRSNAMRMFFFILEHISQRTPNNVHRFDITSNLNNRLFRHISPTMTSTIKRLFLLPPNCFQKRRVNRDLTRGFLLSRTAKARFNFEIRTRNGVRGLFIRREGTAFRAPDAWTFIDP